MSTTTVELTPEPVQRLDGVAVVTLALKTPAALVRIALRNSCSATITVRAAATRGGLGNAGSVVVLPPTVLMPHPHCADGAYARFAFPLAPLPGGAAAAELQLILRQPSPHWRAFGVDDVAVFAPLAAPALVTPDAGPAALRDWLQAASLGADLARLARPATHPSLVRLQLCCAFAVHASNPMAPAARWRCVRHWRPVLDYQRVCVTPTRTLLKSSCKKNKYIFCCWL
jgi:hypothetical protein